MRRSRPGAYANRQLRRRTRGDTIARSRSERKLNQRSLTATAKRNRQTTEDAIDRLLTLVLCGFLGALLLGVMGAAWGGIVRVMANLRGGVPDATLAESLRRGARGGAGFLAVLGGVLGVLVGLIERSADTAVEALLANVGTVGVIMLVIVGMIGLPATGLVWLALRSRRVRLPETSADPSKTDNTKTQA